MNKHSHSTKLLHSKELTHRVLTPRFFVKDPDLHQQRYCGKIFFPSTSLVFDFWTAMKSKDGILSGLSFSLRDQNIKEETSEDIREDIMLIRGLLDTFISLAEGQNFTLDPVITMREIKNFLRDETPSHNNHYQHAIIHEKWNEKIEAEFDKELAFFWRRLPYVGDSLGDEILIIEKLLKQFTPSWSLKDISQDKIIISSTTTATTATSPYKSHDLSILENLEHLLAQHLRRPKKISLHNEFLQ